MTTRHGMQPGHAILIKDRWTIKRAAREIGVDWQHLGKSLRGYVTPNPIVREKLPKLVGHPLEELYTPDVLAHKFWCKGPTSSNHPPVSSR